MKPGAWKTFIPAKRRECLRCRRLVTGTFVPPEIVEGAKLAVLGEAPGEVEAKEKRPFCGPAGRVLDDVLKAAGTHRGLVSTGNTVMCFVKGNPTPEADEIGCCADLVELYLEDAGAEVTLAVGQVAATRALGVEKSKAPWRGSVLVSGERVVVGHVKTETGEVYKSGKRKGQSKFDPVPVEVCQQPRLTIATIHPAALIYTGMADWPLVVADASRAARIARGEALVEVGTEARTGGTVGAGVVEAFIRNRPELCIDVETDDEGRLELVGIARNEDEAVVARPTAELGRLLSDWSRETGRTFIAHNSPFDLDKLTQIGAEIACPVWDTMHAAQFERPDLARGSRDDDERGAEWNEYGALDMVASRMPGLWWVNHKEEFRTGEVASGVRYCALDACTEFYLYRELSERLRRTKRLKLFEGTLMPLLRYVLTPMEAIGIRRDDDEWQSISGRLYDTEERLKAEWYDQVDISPSRTKALMDYFYGTLGIKPVYKGRGASKRPTLDKDAIVELSGRHPECKPLTTLVAWRHVAKMIGTYAERGADERGHFRFYYNLTGPHTGRLSSDGQQIPRPTKPERGDCEKGVAGCACGRLRRMFTHDKGDVALICADYSQIEARLTAVIAGEEWLVEAFENPDFDYHQSTADLMLKALRHAVSRDDGKKANHALNYVMTEVGVARHFKCSVEQGRRIRNAILDTRPKTKLWWAEVEKEVAKRGYVTNPMGRRIYIRPSPTGQYELSKAVAAIPQSTAGDVIFRAMLRCYEAGLKMRLQAHDELVFTTDDPDRDVKTVRECMELAIEELGGWSCPVDIGVGTTWEEAKLNS